MMQDERERDRDFEPGNTGGWSADDQDAPQPPHATPEKATREDDDPERQRRGDALANRRETATEDPELTHDADQGASREGASAEPSNRRGMHPGERGTRRGEEGRDG